MEWGIDRMGRSWGGVRSESGRGGGLGLATEGQLTRKTEWGDSGGESSNTGVCDCENEGASSEGRGPKKRRCDKGPCEKPRGLVGVIAMSLG